MAAHEMSHDDDILDLACAGPAAAIAGQIIAEGRTAEHTIALTSFVATVSAEVARMERRLGTPLACSRGCSGCCRSLTVCASIPEAIAVAAHIRTKFDADDRARVDRNLDEYVRATEGMAFPAWDRAAVTCPFLAGHECSVYDARPAACYLRYSLDAAACRANTVRPVGAEHSYVPLDVTIARVTASIQGGVQAAIRAAGFDYRDIDYPLGVRLALADPALIDTWWDHPRAFDSAAIDRAHPGAPDRRELEAFADHLYGEILDGAGPVAERPSEVGLLFLVAAVLAAIDRAHPGDLDDRRERKAFADRLYGEIVAKLDGGGPARSGHSGGYGGHSGGYGGEHDPQSHGSFFRHNTPYCGSWGLPFGWLLRKRAHH